MPLPPVGAPEPGLPDDLWCDRDEPTEADLLGLCPDLLAGPPDGAGTVERTRPGCYACRCRQLEAPAGRRAHRQRPEVVPALSAGPRARASHPGGARVLLSPEINLHPYT